MVFERRRDLLLARRDMGVEGFGLFKREFEFSREVCKTTELVVKAPRF
jgi:hypothetical protein